MKRNILAIVFFVHVSFACSNPYSPHEESTGFDGSILVELTFEERMAIRAALTRLTADAQKEADELYNAFESRELAILNLETKIELELQKHRVLMNQYDLTSGDLDYIINEYVSSQGVRLRDQN